MEKIMFEGMVKEISQQDFIVNNIYCKKKNNKYYLLLGADGFMWNVVLTKDRKWAMPCSFELYEKIKKFKKES